MVVNKHAAEGGDCYYPQPTILGKRALPWSMGPSFLLQQPLVLNPSVGRPVIVECQLVSAVRDRLPRSNLLYWVRKRNFVKYRQDQTVCRCVAQYYIDQ